MRIPKQITIAGQIWKVVINKNQRGAWYDGTKQKISIGTKNSSQGYLRDVFLHEIIEAILSERLLRYQLPYTGNDNGNYLFVLNHIQFENAIKDIGFALKDMLI